MKIFRCRKCSYGSLVRSNFRGTPEGEFECRGIERCEDRKKEAAS